MFDDPVRLENFLRREYGVFPVNRVELVPVEYPVSRVRFLRHGEVEVQKAVFGRAVHGQIMFRLHRHAGNSRHCCGHTGNYVAPCRVPMDTDRSLIRTGWRETF